MNTAIPDPIPVDTLELSECLSLQKEEYEVLESIYPECVSSHVDDKSLKLEVSVEFEGSKLVSVIQTDEQSVPQTPNGRSPEDMTLSALPPLLIEVQLPPQYPLFNPPQLISIRATHLWMSNLSTLHNVMNEMWKPGEGVLYNWVEYIRTGQFLEDLGMISPKDNSRIFITHPAPDLIAPLLTTYDTLSKSTQFSKNSYPCSVCLTSVKGSKCLKLSCEHIFCRSCLTDFWGLCIEEGDVKRVGCPDPACVKSGREAVEEEVARVLTETELRRWRWLRAKSFLEKDPSIVHCPVELCQTPVPKAPDADEYSGWARLRVCSNCNFTFCAFCRRTWHGLITPCPIAHAEKVVLEYLATEEGSAARSAIERRYGKTLVVQLVKNYEEEQANHKWLKASTTECPGCRCRVEKSLGCNHMTCWKCQEHFCYRCGKRLPRNDGYSHFSIVGGSCYMKLFDYAEEDNEWQPIEGFREDD